MAKGERYEPSSALLKAILAEEQALADDANLEQVIALTRDDDASNRDWATMLLAQEEIDTPAVREALFRAASDEEDVIRGEAMLGLAIRDPEIALPLVQEALGGESVCAPMLEAALLCAHPSLIGDLRIWAEPSDMPLLDDLAGEALAACEKITN
ncbi:MULTISPECIES: HEAT repeat domain-containing protein [unclassified Sphingomonas]|uniref:HEAT repeat domain-containing protein n=1 Tax=unclassified Sphingomonas TaxID=196159 RepID=UPI0022B4C78C|nr:HEAT repeat domain-containing protein [Sphingomonas sp. NIBR02145]WHU01612.1 lyase [Sphingomonas sp. NIBR02145]|eukprot:TRINITY_DN59844_c0_g1_i1.p3 TRINITY_DN59844_c0_g1~~TRINITY_DN59844_c0_g1_i1.p3  ORF type:complete len:155 (+),score=37.50 TRINITY_DN59844_c0_g1_i1:576-1040(+)